VRAAAMTRLLACTGCAPAAASLLPFTADGLFVSLPALVMAQRRPGTPEPVAWVPCRIVTQPGAAQRRGQRGLRDGVASAGGTGKPDRFARQPFRDFYLQRMKTVTKSDRESRATPAAPVSGERPPLPTPCRVPAVPG
jgi:hypothetical protein